MFYLHFRFFVSYLLVAHVVIQGYSRHLYPISIHVNT
jgi:hypothetical protein